MDDGELFGEGNVSFPMGGSAEAPGSPHQPVLADVVGPSFCPSSQPTDAEEPSLARTRARGKNDRSVRNRPKGMPLQGNCWSSPASFPFIGGVSIAQGSQAPD